MRARNISLGRIIEYSIIDTIWDEAVLIQIADDELNPRVIYLSELPNIWLMPCNVGKTECSDNEVERLYIPAENWKLTGQLVGSNTFNNRRIFSPNFTSNNAFKVNARLDLTDYAALIRNGVQKGDERWFETPFEAFNGEDTEEQEEAVMQYLINMSRYPDIPNTLPSYDYMKKQIEFVSNLSSREKEVLHLYSHNGDVLLNKYIRNGRVFDDSGDIVSYYKYHMGSFVNYMSIIGTTLLREMLETMYRDLVDIFEKAPRTDRPFILYRGTITADHFNGTVNSVYANRGILSTSFNVNVGVKFASSGKNSTFVNIIHVAPGSKLIYNLISRYPQEYEFIVPDNSYFIVTKKFQMQDYCVYIKENGKPMMRRYYTNECVLLKE